MSDWAIGDWSSWRRRHVQAAVVVVLHTSSFLSPATWKGLPTVQSMGMLWRTTTSSPSDTSNSLTTHNTTRSVDSLHLKSSLRLRTTSALSNTATT